MPRIFALSGAQGFGDPQQDSAIALQNQVNRFSSSAGFEPIETTGDIVSDPATAYALMYIYQSVGGDPEMPNLNTWASDTEPTAETLQAFDTQLLTEELKTKADKLFSGGTSTGTAMSTGAGMTEEALINLTQPKTFPWMAVLTAAGVGLVGYGAWVLAKRNRRNT